MLNKSSASVSHCEHAIDLVNQLMSKNVIGVVDIHRCVSVKTSVSVSVNAAGSKNMEYVNKIDSNIRCDRISFQKR